MEIFKQLVEKIIFDELWSNLFCVENKESNGFFWDRKFEINVGQSLLNSLMKVTLVGWYVYPTQDDCVVVLEKVPSEGS